MAGSREPGPLGGDPEVQDIDDGTLVLGRSPRPGPVDRAPAFHAGIDTRSRRAVPPLPQASHGLPSQAKVHVLREGSQGVEVQKLQRQLNARLAPSPRLAIDGLFGPRTRDAVQQYQRGVSIAADGVVGKDTWYYLLKGDKAASLQAPSSTAAASSSGTGALVGSPAGTPSPGLNASNVWEWPLRDKFTNVLLRTAPKVPGGMRDEFV